MECPAGSAPPQRKLLRRKAKRLLYQRARKTHYASIFLYFSPYLPKDLPPPRSVHTQARLSKHLESSLMHPIALII
jgi:hypothetical protein